MGEGKESPVIRGKDGIRITIKRRDLSKDERRVARRSRYTVK